METHGKSWGKKGSDGLENHELPSKNKKTHWYFGGVPPFSHTQFLHGFTFFCFVFEPSTYRTLVLQIFTSLLGIKNDFIPSKQGFQKAKEHVESYAQTWHSYIATSLYIGMIK
jgi:hypothetical protein